VLPRFGFDVPCDSNSIQSPSLAYELKESESE